MINLATGNDLRAAAGSNTAITYTITGMELLSTGPTETYKILAGPAQLTTSVAVIYGPVAASTSTFIKTIHLQNTTASPVTVDFYINGSAASNRIHSINIPLNGSAIFNQEGWTVYDSNGSMLFTSPTTLTGDVTGTGAGTIPTTIAANAVDNTKLADMAQATFKMRAAGSGTGDPIDGTPVQAKTALAIVSTDLSDFTEASQDAVGAILTDSPTTNFTYNDAANTITAISGPWVNVQDNSYAAAVLPGNSAATNVTNLTALFAAAPGGSTLYFPGGTYNFNANMNIGAKTFTFMGEGNQLTGGFTILALTTGTTGLFTLTTGNWYTTFKNLTFGCITTQVSGSAVTVNDNVAVNFTNCTFAAFGGQWFNCIDYTGTAQSANTTVIDTCFFSGFKNFGVNVASDGASLVIVNTIIQGQWGTTVQTAAACVNVVNAGALQVDNCDLLGATNNMLLAPTAGKVIASVYVTNTYMDASFGSCLKITGAGATVRCRFISVSFTTSNATTALSAVEISTTVTAGAQGIDFENCSVLNTFGTTGTTNGFLITGAADFSIIACRIAGWTNGINITPFNSNGKTQPMIEDNTIGPTGGFGGNTTGIILNAGAVQYGDIMVQNNICSGNTTNISDASTQTATAMKYIGGNTGAMPGLTITTAANATVTTTVETVVLKLPIPANSLRVGSAFRVNLWMHPLATSITTTRIRIGTTGTTADASVIIVAATALTNAGSRLVQGLTAINVIGAAATHIGGGAEQVGAISAAGVAAAATGTFNSTVANFITVTVQNTTSTTTTVFAGTLESV